MTGHDDFDRTLAGWFEADAQAPAPAGGLDRLLDATRRRSPRPVWLAGPGSRWVEQVAGAASGVLSIPRVRLRWSTAILLLLVLAVLASGAILIGARLLQPSPLPISHLAYGLDGDIFVADWDGRNPVRIADGAPNVRPEDCCLGFWGEGSMWSPDGQHLAYRSGLPFGADGSVHISDPAGHVVTSFPGTGWLVSWSPDSTRVVTSIDLGHTYGIYGLDGVRQALLAVPLGYEVHGDYDPVWSPDGESILMPIAPTSGTPSEIWELPIDGGTPRRVPDDDPRSHRDAAYSHDGDRVAFVEFGSLVVAAADGGDRQVLISGDVLWRSLALSPTGDRVAFTVNRRATPEADAWDLRVVDVPSGRVTTLFSAPESAAVGDSPPVAIRFSPEGDRILFAKGDVDGDHLRSINVDGSNAQLLVTGADWADWQWQPAGP